MLYTSGRDVAEWPPMLPPLHPSSNHRHTLAYTAPNYQCNYILPSSHLKFTESRPDQLRGTFVNATAIVLSRPDVSCMTDIYVSENIKRGNTMHPRATAYIGIAAQMGCGAARYVAVAGSCHSPASPACRRGRMGPGRSW